MPHEAILDVQVDASFSVGDDSPFGACPIPRLDSPIAGVYTWQQKEE